MTRPLSPYQFAQVAVFLVLVPFGLGGLFSLAFSVLWEQYVTTGTWPTVTARPSPLNVAQVSFETGAIAHLTNTISGRPSLDPKPEITETWDCEVVVIGGTLGGVAAASHAMKAGARTCLIELTPWLGGQISAQGVSAIDESLAMRRRQNFSDSWQGFKRLIRQQSVQLPSWSRLPASTTVAQINHCWVGLLCFPPQAGAMAAEQLLQASSQSAPGSRWGTAIAFKGAEFDPLGRTITAIYAVRRTPREAGDRPQGRLSQELSSWYSWTEDEQFHKTPVRLQAPPGKRLIVIDATDTGELVAWANIPYRTGSESQATTGERHASGQDNPECTQAFTYPFALAIRDDQGVSAQPLAQVEPVYAKSEHRREFSLSGFPMFSGGSLFHYRRIVSTTGNSPEYGTPALGDISVINWTQGNDWNWMNPPLLLSPEKLAETGQYDNWMGGLSWSALGHGEDHALLFAQWLLETQATPRFPLSYLAGTESPMGTVSGLSMVPYIREGRRILGRPAYGDSAFMMREADVRTDLPGGRDFRATAIALTHYDIDIHGCRYRNWQPSGEAQQAGAREFVVRPTLIPIESLIPQGVDNLLIGGKSMAVTHIVNAMTRVHYSEWSVGAASGAIAAWLVTPENSALSPADIVPKGLMPKVQQHLKQQGLRLEW